MRRFLNCALFLAVFGASNLGIAAAEAVVFSGESIYKQAQKVAFLLQADGSYNLQHTLFEYDKNLGLTHKTRIFVRNLNCDIDELKSLRCDTVTEDGENVSVYTLPADEARRFKLVIESDMGAFPLGWALVWETR